MAIRGRKPKPTAIKRLEGNPGKRPFNSTEPYCSSIPDCPDWLDEKAKEEWQRMGQVLAGMGMLTDMDMVAFAGYCQAYARWREAEMYLSTHDNVIETKSGYMQQVPQVSIAQSNFKLMLKCCEQFGLTPSARSRIELSGQADEASDEMEALLSG